MVWIDQFRMKMIMANDYGNIDEAYKITYRIYLRGVYFFNGTAVSEEVTLGSVFRLESKNLT
jgi:hypothetical protein